jgi:hypothetical protein
MSPNTHGALEPLIGILLIVAPWLFAFSDVSDAKTISIIAGIVLIVGGMMTRWRYAVVRVIPLPMHFAMDVVVAVFLIVCPFIFGFSDIGSATRFMIIFGACELVAAVSTRWNPDEAYDDAHHHHPGQAAPA